MQCALLSSREEREQFEVSVVEDCVVVGGEEVAARLERVLSDCLSDKQLSVVMDALPEAVAQSEDFIGGQVRSEISRVSTLSGSSGCVVAGRLLLD